MITLKHQALAAADKSDGKSDSNNLTSVAVVPGDWETSTLGELEQRGDIRLFRGKVISQKDIDQLPGEYPIYSSSVQFGGLFGSYGKYMFNEELITWSVDGGGNFFYRPKHCFSVTNVCGYLRVLTPYINYRFLSYQLQLLHSLKIFDYTMKAHPSVIKTAYNVALPQPIEQSAIVEALSDIDRLLVALEAVITKKRAIKQGTMQQLLTGRTRLPGFNGAWETIRMGRIGSTYNGLSGKSKVDFEGGEAQYLTFLGVLQNAVLDRTHSSRVHVASRESQNSVLKGDLLFNGTSETPNELAMGAVMGEQIGNLYLNSFCFGFRMHQKDRHVPLFLAFFFRSSAGRVLMSALAQGATRYNMSKLQFLSLEISVPSYSEQSAIATVLSDMDAEIDALKQRVEKTLAIKHGMMQQLLSGRVRLVESGTGT